VHNLFILILSLAFCGCSPQEKVDLEPEKIQLSDITGKKMSEVEMKIPDEIIRQFTPHYTNENEKLDFTFTKKFTSEDIKVAQNAIRFLEKLTGLTYPQNFNNVYWSDDLLKAGYLGMTVYQKGRISWLSYIALASELKVNDNHNLNELRDFGAVCVHEFSHAQFLHNETIVRYLIDAPIGITFDTKFHTPISQFFLFNEINTNNVPYKNLLEMAAFEANVPVPWVYYHDIEENKIFSTSPPNMLFIITNLMNLTINTNVISSNNIISTNLP